MSYRPLSGCSQMSGQGRVHANLGRDTYSKCSCLSSKQDICSWHLWLYTCSPVTTLAPHGSKSSRGNPVLCLLPPTYLTAHYYVNICHSTHIVCTPKDTMLSPEHNGCHQAKTLVTLWGMQASIPISWMSKRLGW